MMALGDFSNFRGETMRELVISSRIGDMLIMQL